MFRAHTVFELLLYSAACLYAGYRSVSEIRIALSETEPTAFTAAEFATRFQGQQWVRVTGHVSVDHQHARQSTYEAHRGKNLAYVTVPVVAEEWDARQPVHVLATFGPMPSATVKNWQNQMRGKVQSVEGKIRPGGVRDAGAWFPSLRISPSYVIINVGTRPNHVPTLAGFLVLMLASGGLLIRRLYLTLS